MLEVIKFLKKGDGVVFWLGLLNIRWVRLSDQIFIFLESTRLPIVRTTLGHKYLYIKAPNYIWNLGTFN